MCVVISQCGYMHGSLHLNAYMFLPLQYRGLAPMYYRGSAAAIVVYDITSEVRAQRSHDCSPHVVGKGCGDDPI